MTNVFSAPGHWVSDIRGGGRGVRVSAHAEAGFLVLSTWKAGTCVGTVRLLPEEAADLVSGVTSELAKMARTYPTATEQPASETRLASLEDRITRLEQDRP